MLETIAASSINRNLATYRKSDVHKHKMLRPVLPNSLRLALQWREINSQWRGKSVNRWVVLMVGHLVCRR